MAARAENIHSAEPQNMEKDCKWRKGKGLGAKSKRNAIEAQNYTPKMPWKVRGAGNGVKKGGKDGMSLYGT